MINESGRKKLIIVKVFEPRQVQRQTGTFEVLEFTATIEGATESGKYSVSSKYLIEQIKVGAVIDCDVAVKASDKLDPDGNPYQNRKVTQIYVDGKPVKEAKQFGGGYQRLDNTVSIEAQVAVKEIGECWRSGKLKDDDGLVSVYKGWLAAKLGNILPKPAEKAPIPFPGVEELWKDGKTPPASSTTSGSTAPSDNPLLAEALKCQSGPALYNFAMKHGLMVADIVKLGLPSRPLDVKDVASAAKVLFG